MGVLSNVTGGAAAGSAIPGVGTLLGAIGGAGKSLLGSLFGDKDKAYRAKMQQTWIDGALKAVANHRAAGTSQSDWITLHVNKAPVGFRDFLPRELYANSSIAAPAGNIIPAYSGGSNNTAAVAAAGTTFNATGKSSKIILYVGIGVAVLLVIAALARR